MAEPPRSRAGTRTYRTYSSTWTAIAAGAAAPAQRIQFGDSGWLTAWSFDGNRDVGSVRVRRSWNNSDPIDNVETNAGALFGHEGEIRRLPKEEWVRVRSGATVTVELTNQGTAAFTGSMTAHVSVDGARERGE